MARNDPPQAELSPADLVWRCQKGERAAQSEFFKRYRDDAAKTLYRILGPSPDLEDALQDVFIEVFRSIDKFRGQSQITTWLYRVCVNIALQKLRRTKRRGEVLDADPPTQPSHETPVKALERKQQQELVYRLLETLSPKKRMVFVLHEIMGMDAQEISQVVGSNVLTVRTRLHYARKEFYQLALSHHSGQQT